MDKMLILVCENEKGRFSNSKGEEKLLSIPSLDSFSESFHAMTRILRIIQLKGQLVIELRGICKVT